MCYFVPLRMGTRKEFSDSFHTFTCCVGSGIENHAKYAEQIYSTDGKQTLYINLFIPSQLNWKQQAVKMEMFSGFPYTDKMQVNITKAPGKKWKLKLRQPYWCRQPKLYVNGVQVEATPDETGYLAVERQWKSGDVITLQTPMHLYTEAMPDNDSRVAIKYGPVVLAGQLGTEKPDPVWGTPVLLTDQRDVNKWLQPVPGKPLHFAMQKVGQPFDVELQPFYDTYNGYYSVYWDFFTPDDWERKKQEYEAEKKRQEQIEKRTIDHFRVGEMQPERDHQLEATERSYVSDALDRKGREARRDHYFSFSMKVDGSGSQALLLTYIGDDKDRTFDIEVDGVKLTTVEWKGGATGKFYDVEYPLPAAMTAGKKSIRVKVLANHGKTAGRVFGVRTMRAE
jgi:hypothetical protein